MNDHFFETIDDTLFNSILTIPPAIVPIPPAIQPAIVPIPPAIQPDIVFEYEDKEWYSLGKLHSQYQRRPIIPYFDKPIEYKTSKCDVNHVSIISNILDQYSNIENGLRVNRVTYGLAVYPLGFSLSHGCVPYSTSTINISTQRTMVQRDDSNDLVLNVSYVASTTILSIYGGSTYKVITLTTQNYGNIQSAYCGLIDMLALCYHTLRCFWGSSSTRLSTYGVSVNLDLSNKWYNNICVRDTYIRAKAIRASRDLLCQELRQSSPSHARADDPCEMLEYISKMISDVPVCKIFGDIESYGWYTSILKTFHVESTSSISVSQIICDCKVVRFSEYILENIDI